jgi:excisionase family DNA binding protein
MNGEELLTPEAAAAELGVTSRTVRNWCRSGRLPAIKAGRQWRIPRSWLDSFVELETHRAVKQPA